jgi:hypothetical protein
VVAWILLQFIRSKPKVQVEAAARAKKGVPK